MIFISRIDISPRRNCATSSIGYSMKVITATKLEDLRSKSQKLENLRLKSLKN